MVLSFREVFDLVFMTAALGLIFSTFLKKFQSHKRDYDPLEKKTGIDWKLFRFAVYITAPAIILHELGHKFVAMGFGLEATFHAAYNWLGIGLLLALLNTGILFFVPAYVSIGNGAGVAPSVFSIIAFSGPLMNLILWLGTAYILRKGNFAKKHTTLLVVTKKINMFLFIFNMLPIPGFDGFKVYRGIIQTIF